MPGRLKGRQKIVAGLGCWQGRTLIRAIVCAIVATFTSRRAGPRACLNAGHGGQSINNVEWVDHCDESRETMGCEQIMSMARGYMGRLALLGYSR